MRYLRLQLRKLGELKLGLIILGVGVLLGFLFARLFKGFYWNSMDLINTDYLYRIRDTTINYPVLLRYVLWNVYRDFVLFWVVCATAVGIPYMALCIVYSGFQGGFFLTVILMKYHFKGILLIFGYTFPHYLLYIPVAFMCLRTGYWLCRSMYYEKTGKKGRAERIAKQLLVITGLALILLIGALLETYVSSFILRKILLLF
ncbi:stage II sporulation protein M [Anaerocolumna sp. AGMB13025]|uniref:stage II sporulation protein M n=1 Tax=Anaerocolumna sp. AGMB13025 TaxID=3039116 RepID=UPI00241CF95B|nr:stage II sporulation protein M [Anaerocolumna sp. AGMB13025]WFR60015.1 stage II sporulation protein M [Anaerocolumna sp. AGMB13025]